jgi:hypothetical protein
VTVAESGLALFPDAQIPEPVRPRRSDVISVLDTTELRWFVPGPLPAHIRSWFTGVAEERCDTYLLDGSIDVGVKRRFRETLELKVRQSLDGRIEIGGVSLVRSRYGGGGALPRVSSRTVPMGGGSTSTSRSSNDGSRSTEPRSPSRRTRG